MARGKQISPEDVYAIMASWMTTGNYAETARMLDRPETTVRDIVTKHKNDPEYEELRREKMKEFSARASEVIQKGMILLNRRFDRAIASEEELDHLIDEIYETPREEISEKEKQSLVAKIRSLQLQDIKAITTAIGTLYDKKALADGNATSNIGVTVKLPEGVDDYAG